MSSKGLGQAGGRIIEPLLSIMQVADTLGVCTKTVYRHIAAGRLRAVRAGRLWRVAPGSLREFLRQPSGYE